jgi:thiol-disulfide isomerase/thioredoxin
MKQKYEFHQTIDDLFEFCLPCATDSTLFCSMQITKDKPVILMYFHPECDLCISKVQQIQQISEISGDIQWILVSFAEKDTLMKFMETYQLTDISNLVVLVDFQLSLHDHLQLASIPAIYIYDRRHQLVAVKRGSAKFEKIIQLAYR